MHSSPDGIGPVLERRPARKRRRAAIAAGLLAVLVSAFGSTAQAGAFTQSAQTQFNLTACRLPDANHDGLADYTLPLGGQFICNDADYTSGNLGKSWNELDLVPHRLTTQVGTQANATTDYDVIIAADNRTSGHDGYDVLSSATLNVAKSHASCTVSSGAQLVTGGVTGGADQVIYRVLTVHQSKGTTCVFDYYQRLALGAHSYPGSSLQSYMFESDDFKTGKRTISIPVREIAPQELNKDMSASRGTDHVWNITKGATPANLNFQNTCDSSQPLNAGVQITVTWEKLQASPSGPATIVTHVYAKNPALRTITVDVTDKIYAGTDQSTLLDTASSATTDVPANTTMLVLTHTFEWNDPTTLDVNDVASAAYTDKVTGIPVPGQTTASAAATIQLTGAELNASAIINDAESITGAGFSYSADSFSGAAGAFDGGYVAGTSTTGTVSWTSALQTGSGSVAFDKSVYVAKGTIGNGVLSDTATLTGADGFTTSAGATVDISANTLAQLTIDKTIPDILQGGEQATFDFHVKATNDPNAADVATSSLTFGAGDTHKTATVGNLAPGVYYVFEDAAAGFKAQDPVKVDLSGDACTGTASFTNVAELASAKVKKVTAPAGFEGNWTFDLKDGNGNVLETVTTTSDAAVSFSTPLGEGSYSIVEHTQPGWSSDGGSAECSFTVNLPADANRVFSCTYTNTYQPSVKLTKTGDTLSKIGDSVTYKITLDNTSSAGGAAGAPSLECTISDPTIGFSKSVTLGPGESDVSSVPFTIPVGASDPFVNKATASCHYNGSTTEVAASEATHSINLFQPRLVVSKSGPAYSKVGDTATYTVVISNTSSSDTPALVLDSFSDSKASSATAPAFCNTLTPGDTCTFTYDYTVQAGDDSGLPGAQLSNTATAHYHPTGFPNDITGSSTWKLTLLHPAFTVAKSCAAEPVPQEGPAKFTVTIKNTGDADLSLTADDGIGTFTLAAGATKTVTVSIAGPFTGQATVSNMVTASATLDPKYALSNTLGPKSADATCKVGGRVTVKKLTQGVVDPTRDWTFKVFNGPHMSDTSSAFLGTAPLATQSSLGVADGVLAFGNLNLDPSKTYTLCEVNVPAGWTSQWQVGATNVTPYNPNAVDSPAQDIGNRCFDFGAGTAYAIQAGGTIAFQVDNRAPGGDARTIGYWKNWSSCTGGNQVRTAAKNGGPAAGWYTLDDVLTSPGITVGNFLIPAANATYTYTVNGKPVTKTGCQIAVALLSKQDAAKGTNMSSDAAYALAAQLIAAEANLAAGAKTCGGTVNSLVLQANQLLASLNFNGTGSYLPSNSTSPLRGQALSLASQLDAYNNNKLC